MDRTNVCVDLRIMSYSFNIQEITNALNIMPTETWQIGDNIRNISKKRTYTAWTYSTGSEETLNINTQVEKVGCLFIPKVDILYDLKKKYALDFSIDITIIIENKEPPAIYLEDPIIQFASKLHARFDFDTYVS